MPEVWVHKAFIRTDWRHSQLRTTNFFKASMWEESRGCNFALKQRHVTEHLSYIRLTRRTKHQFLCVFGHLKTPSRLTGWVLRKVFVCYNYIPRYRSKTFHPWAKSESNSSVKLTRNDASKSSFNCLLPTHACTNLSTCSPGRLNFVLW